MLGAHSTEQNGMPLNNEIPVIVRQITHAADNRDGVERAVLRSLVNSRSLNFMSEQVYFVILHDCLGMETVFRSFSAAGITGKDVRPILLNVIEDLFSKGQL